ncbi:hypothetical protein PSTT_12778 [Puccinia striiformis]|uniref:Uncharacterized protein n=1 Tax=Puccinia striiformis TaxID=27350 RepID=A0A2S4UUT3_9BASI|nr:hypothetical protein PSTT_12778 [Puccinia striiformis]
MPWLLSMIHDPHGQLITHPVPTSTNMITNMRSRMLPSGSEHSQECDQLHANSRVRSRIAMASRPRQAGRSSQIDLDQVVQEGEEYGSVRCHPWGPILLLIGCRQHSSSHRGEVIAKMVLSAGERPVFLLKPSLIHSHLVL